jgi:hypothetical protein
MDRNFLSEVVIGDESLVDRNPVKGTKNWACLEDSASNAGGAENFQAVEEVQGPVYKSKEERTDF